MSWLWGVGLAGCVAAVAYRMRLLTLGGALSATLVGASVFGVGGVVASAPMIAFFFSSSLLPRLLGRPHKTERRIALQVLANGLAPALCCWGVWLSASHASPFWLGYAASLAVAAADTWATEFGVRFGKDARLITTGKPVPKGESGGVSLAGTLGGCGGAMAIALLGAPLLSGAGAIAVAVGVGVWGMLLDSWLGATLQARYRCPLCQAIGEQRRCCNAPAIPQRGVAWMDNNAVNLISTLAGAILGIGAAWLLHL
ncbi:MAG: hypothetical protein KatS3mg019_1646 [Fimbriimonadales bacterium]|nr:MAG: hypothetical protein KatS3mg019_1646 [Fimbriimonadales bacterium]